MVRELVHDPMFLGIKSKPATKEDSLIASARYSKRSPRDLRRDGGEYDRKSGSDHRFY